MKRPLIFSAQAMRVAVLTLLFFTSLTAARAQNVAVQYTTTSDYGSGFTAEIKIINNGSQTIDGWTLAFDMTQTMQSVFSATLVSHVGNRYTVKDAGFNKTIPVGGSVTFGFNGSPGNITAIPTTNFAFNGVAVIAQTPTTFSFQGRFSDGSTAASGIYDLQFALYDDGGTQIGQTLQRNDLTVANGVFTTFLDFGDGVFSGENRRLEIRVRRGAETGAFTTLSPRQPLAAAPYAIRSLNAATADNAANLGGVVAQNFVQTNDSRLTNPRPPTAGSTNYIQNTTTAQSANFSISGSGTIGDNLTVGGTIASGCRAGFTAINGGRLCVSAIQPATTFYNAVNACTGMSARVGNSADVMQTFSQTGFNYFANTTQGWLADHLGDDLWGTWNVTAPSANFDGAAVNVSGGSVPFLPFRCVY